MQHLQVGALRFVGASVGRGVRPSVGSGVDWRTGVRADAGADARSRVLVLPGAQGDPCEGPAHPASRPARPRHPSARGGGGAEGRTSPLPPALGQRPRRRDQLLAPSPPLYWRGSGCSSSRLFCSSAHRPPPPPPQATLSSR